MSETERVAAAEATGREIDLAVRNLVEEGDRRARDILQQRRADLDAGVALLIANETVTAEQFAPLLGKTLEAATQRSRSTLAGAL